MPTTRPRLAVKKIPTAAVWVLLLSANAPLAQRVVVEVLFAVSGGLPNPNVPYGLPASGAKLGARDGRRAHQAEAGRPQRRPSLCLPRPALGLAGVASGAFDGRAAAAAGSRSVRH